MKCSSVWKVWQVAICRDCMTRICQDCVCPCGNGLFDANEMRPSKRKRWYLDDIDLKLKWRRGMPTRHAPASWFLPPTSSNARFRDQMAPTLRSTGSQTEPWTPVQPEEIAGVLPAPRFAIKDKVITTNLLRRPPLRSPLAISDSGSEEENAEDLDATPAQGSEFVSEPMSVADAKLESTVSYYDHDTGTAGHRGYTSIHRRSLSMRAMGSTEPYPRSCTNLTVFEYDSDNSDPASDANDNSVQVLP